MIVGTDSVWADVGGGGGFTTPGAETSPARTGMDTQRANREIDRILFIFWTPLP